MADLVNTGMSSGATVTYTITSNPAVAPTGQLTAPSTGTAVDSQVALAVAPTDEGTSTKCPNCGTECDSSQELADHMGSCHGAAPMSAADEAMTVLEAEAAAVENECVECLEELATEDLDMHLPGDTPIPPSEEPDQTVRIDPSNPGRFRSTMVVEGERTADNRMIASGATKWRTPPLPVMLMTKTAEGHDGAEVCAVIESITRDGDKIISEGRFDTSPTGCEAARLVANKVLTGVSIDGGDVEGELIVEAEDDQGIPTKVLAQMTAITILGFTICPFQAISSAGIEWIAPTEAELSADDTTFAASAARNLPIGPRDRAWDASAADARVRSWAGAEEAPNSKYGQAFFWKDGDGTQYGDFHLGFADVIDGKLTAIPRGIFAAANAVQGGRGASLPYATQVKPVIAAYYGKVAKAVDDPSIKAPWESALGDVVTAGSPIAFPGRMFENPKFITPTPIRIDPDGHVYGHAALWGSCHTGFPGTCVTPPRSLTDYSHFLTGSLPTEDGHQQPVGTISLSTTHANHSLGAREASLHYDHTGTSAAFVNVGEDDHGIWVSGVLKPGISDETATELAASSLSGDWRRIGRGLELVALLAVNVPGFPVAHTSNEVQTSLVAAGYGPQKRTKSLLAAELDARTEHDNQRFSNLEKDLARSMEMIERLNAQLAPIVRERLAARFIAEA